MTDTTLRDSEQPAESASGAPLGEVAGGGWRLGLLIASVVALGVFAGLGWLVIVAALFVMIFLHELGHFLTAKWSGMKVTEFFLFFGPKIWSFRRGETEYGIKCIPLGAYVRIIGMSNLEQDVPPEDEHRTYRQKSYPKRLLVVSAGSLMHFLQAFVLFVVVFSVMGVPGNHWLAPHVGGPRPDPVEWTIGAVTEGSAAETAGLEPGDDLVSIAGKTLASFDDVGSVVRPRAGQRVELVVERDGKETTLQATLGHRAEDSSLGFLGIGPRDQELPAVRVNPLRGAVGSAEVTAEVMGKTVTGLAAFFTGGVDDFAADVVDGGSASGVPDGGEGDTGGGRAPQKGDENRPLSILGIARIGAGIFEEGIFGFLVLMAWVNISIGILNLIPLLPLDGGHVAIATYERIRSIGRRRYMADVSRLLPITYAVFMFMVMLGVSAIYLDIVDPIG